MSLRGLISAITALGIGAAVVWWLLRKSSTIGTAIRSNLSPPESEPIEETDIFPAQQTQTSGEPPIGSITNESQDPTLPIESIISKEPDPLVSETVSTLNELHDLIPEREQDQTDDWDSELKSLEDESIIDKQSGDNEEVNPVQGSPDQENREENIPGESRKTSHRQSATPFDDKEPDHKSKPGDGVGKPKGLDLNGVYYEPKLKLELPILPRLICWKIGTQWNIGFELDESFLDDTNMEVILNGDALASDEFNSSRYLIPRLNGELIIKRPEGEMNVGGLNQSGSQCFTFKLKGNTGEFVKKVNKGEYLILAPEGWQRDVNQSGPETITPERVSIEGFMAHFFTIGRYRRWSDRIAFITQDGQNIILHEGKPEFELQGTTISAFIENEAPFFAPGLPLITPVGPGSGWSSISKVVMIQEGEFMRGNRWTRPLDPPENATPLDIEEVMREFDSGFSSARLYDKDNRLLDSLGFRFMRHLSEAIVKNHPIAPSPQGHAPVTIQFKHEPGLTIRALHPDFLEIERGNTQTRYMIPHHFSADISDFLLTSPSGIEVKASVLVERLWWALTEEGETPQDWKDQPIEINRTDFKATSKKIFSLKLPCPGWADGLNIGFSEESTTYKRSGTSDSSVITVPLRELSNFTEAEASNQPLWVKVRIDNGKIPESFDVMQVPAPIYWCTMCGYSSSEKADLLNHVGTVHIDQLAQFFRPLNYEELRKQIPKLPHGIYKCSYCNYYVKSDDPRNPTSTICNHIENECPNVPPGMGPPLLKFQTIYDLDEIRKNVFGDLPNIKKCNLCGHQMINTANEDMVKHLIEKHERKLFEFR